MPRFCVIRRGLIASWSPLPFAGDMWINKSEADYLIDVTFVSMLLVLLMLILFCSDSLHLDTLLIFCSVCLSTAIESAVRREQSASWLSWCTSDGQSRRKASERTQID